MLQWCWFNHHCLHVFSYSAITCLLRKPVIIQKCTLSIEEIDLNEVYQPHLIVRGLPPFMSEQTAFLKTHFETLSSTKIKSMDVKGTQAIIHFVNPSGMYSILSLCTKFYPTPIFPLYSYTQYCVNGFRYFG